MRRCAFAFVDDKERRRNKLKLRELSIYFHVHGPSNSSRKNRPQGHCEKHPTVAGTERTPSLCHGNPASHWGSFECAFDIYSSKGLRKDSSIDSRFEYMPKYRLV